MRAFILANYKRELVPEKSSFSILLDRFSHEKLSLTLEKLILEN